MIVRTEVWNHNGTKVIKAVVRDERGRIIGATNQTASVVPTIIGKK